MKKALLVLEDGMVFEGQPLGYEGEAIGEVVFNTAMTGYQEILTDPSYKGQMVLMTCPQIGNYGINPEDAESHRLWADGFIVKESAPISSNWRSRQPLQEYLSQHQVVGIQAIDTRALTRHLRDFGSQQGIISHTNFDPERLVQQVRRAPSIVGRDLVSQVTCQIPYEWKEGSGNWKPTLSVHQPENKQNFDREAYRTVVVDFGVKQNILRRLIDIGYQVQVVPASTSMEEVQALDPHGIILSNGPGDPEGVPYAIETVRRLIGWRPIFGICLGHQILGLALGMKAHKLKFGHHGANHPVLDLRTRKVEITSQNHNFAVGIADKTDQESLEPRIFPTKWGRVQITHRSLNDGCCEGMIGLDTPILSVQYHPEASPGPHDSASLFYEFFKMVKTYHE
ncbi:MAG: glutamine-hydrolyzing carbamoyl-phosphate synthase small subunit [Nitrospirota bacterium]|nr:MAG: glutamine-hydrolyzing carbamoyl-phosphate synthase small subunit [Nitrospirota bacterium]